MHPARQRLAAAFTTIYDHVMSWWGRGLPCTGCGRV
jgi:hypothetical protein